MWVHQLVVKGLARPQDPDWRDCDLFSVSHWRNVPADTEFPFTVPRMQLFSRFYLRRAREALCVELERERVLAWSDHEWIPIARTFFVVER